MLARFPFVFFLLFWFTIPVMAAREVTPVPDNSARTVAPDHDSNYDSRAEHELFEKANAERAKAGVPLLKMDDTVARAARQHCSAMAAHKELSHRFVGEPALMDRIAAASPLHAETVAENVAFADSVDAAHHALMTSEGHRANLLNPKFNVAGFGILRQGDMLYVTQDFATSVEIYSPQRMQEVVINAIQQVRADAKLPRLELRRDASLQPRACDMARADSLRAAHATSGTHLLLYTTMDASSIPSDISRLLLHSDRKYFSVGACYSRSPHYPTGAYWVVLVLR
jgi:uncharacterized protein YkwD